MGATSRGTKGTRASGALRLLDVYAPTALPIVVGRRLIERRLPNLQVELLQPLETGPELIAGVVEQRVDLAPVCELPIFEAIAAGAPIEIVGVTGTFRRVIVVPAASTLQSPDELRGRRVACVMRGGARTVLRRYLAEIGLDESDVELVDLRPSDALAALDADAFDAWSTWSPWVDQAELVGRGRVLVDISHVKSHGLDFVALRSLRSERPEVLASFLEAYAEAGEWALAHPDEAVDYFADHASGILPEAIARALRSGIHFRPWLSDHMVSDLAEGLHRAHEAGYALQLDAASFERRLQPHLAPATAP